MNDIVIPYLKNNSGELEACIALIEKNVPHNNIYVIERFDPIGSHHLSHINQILKLKWALENLDLTDDFYLFNDDFFVLNPVNSIPYYHRGTLSDQATVRRVGYYGRAIKHTKEYLEHGALSYELHTPFLMNKNKLQKLITELIPTMQRGNTPLIRSAYGNRYKVGGEYSLDCKNIADFKGKTFLSTTEQSFRRDIGKYIQAVIE